MNKRNLSVLIALIIVLAVWFPATLSAAADPVLIDDFDRPDALYHGNGWETLNPGYWKIEGNALRRRLSNRGDWGGKLEFPFRSLLHGTKLISALPVLPKNYPPALPFGMIWRRGWKLTGNYTVRIDATIRALPPSQEDTDASAGYRPEYSLMGIGFGSQSLHESWNGGVKGRSPAAWMAVWRGDGRFGIYTHASDAPDTAMPGAEKSSAVPQPGDRVKIELNVSGNDPDTATVTATLRRGSASTTVQCENVERRLCTDGYFGLVGRGLLDFEVNRVELTPLDNKPFDAAVNELHVCYPLGDTLHEENGAWHCTFIALFRSGGQRAEIRVSDTSSPGPDWSNLPVSGTAAILTNEFRLHTAVIDVALPFNPAEKTMYYTVWKDGVDTTADPRTGYLGKKDYVGRLPQLAAPYRLCGLGGHAITGPANMPDTDKFGANWIHGQPTADAYQSFENYGFQILDWEDDVWYLELVLAPSSLDDAYKIITLTIANPTTRWQMMRHWNTINPGDHDFGMNDLHGPEQFAMRKLNNLGQDPEYMRRNYQLVQHLCRGAEAPSGTDNVKFWRKWKMPNKDFTYLILDARSWRDSLDTALWVNYGWGHNEEVYDRTDPMRPLLGEEQFAWLQNIVRTDSSPLICITGLNGLHTIWQGSDSFDPKTGLNFNQRGRGAGDYAGWAKAGSDRVLELLGSRDGIVTVYGDVHSASIMKNRKHRIYECSFGPIGRSGSRGVKKGFGPQMNDYDLRPLEMLALYHAKYQSPKLEKREGAAHWNFLEMHFDPRGARPRFQLKIRNIIDAPAEPPRGGGYVDESAANTGRPLSCTLPPIKTLPNADVLFSTLDHRPIRGARSLADGTVPVHGLIEIDGKDIIPGTQVLMTAYDGEKSESRAIETGPVNEKDLAAFREEIQKLERQAKEEFDTWVAGHQASKKD